MGICCVAFLLDAKDTWKMKCPLQGHKMPTIINSGNCRNGFYKNSEEALQPVIGG